MKTNVLGSNDTSKLKPLSKYQYVTYGLYCASFFSIGILAGSFGPILNDLQQQINVDLAIISSIFSSFAIGQAVAAIIAGIIIKYFNDTPKLRYLTPHNAMALFLITTSSTFLIIPYVYNISFLLILMVLNGMTFGVIASSGNYLIFAIFNVDYNNIYEEKRCNKYNQALQASFALGGFISPIIIEISFKLFNSYQASFCIFSLLLFFPTGIAFLKIQTPKKIDKIIINNISKPIHYGATSIVNDANVNVDTMIRIYKILYYVFCSIFLFAYIGVEYVYGWYITTYGLNHLSLSKAISRLLSSAYWFGLLFGRLVAVPIADCLTPLSMIIKDLIGVSFATILLFVCSGNMFIGNEYGIIVSFSSSIIFGIFLASIYGANYSFANQSLPDGIDSFFVTIMLLISGIATFVIPFMTGYFMSKFSSISFNLVTNGCSVCMIVFFGSCWIVAKRIGILQKRKKLGLLS